MPAVVYEKATVLHLRGAMIETYNRVVDSADFDKLSSITDALK